MLTMNKKLWHQVVVDRLAEKIYLSLTQHYGETANPDPTARARNAFAMAETFLKVRETFHVKS